MSERGISRRGIELISDNRIRQAMEEGQFDNLAGHTIGLLAAGVALATVTTFGWTGSWAGPAAVLAVVRRVLSPLTDW